jgi:hypothetical protein
MSKEQRWQKKKLKQGLCIRCGRGKLFSKTFCRACLQHNRERTRIPGHHTRGRKRKDL